MSIRAIAKDLYRVQQKVHQLEGKLQEYGSSVAQKKAVEEDLRHARAELSMLKRIMDGEKESAETRQKFKGFGL